MPRAFPTGIQAAEPSFAFLPDGRIAYRGWDRPKDADVGTGTVAVGPASAGGWQTVFRPGERLSHDPYLHVDPDTGRLFIVDLHVPGETHPEQFCTVISYSDDDGSSWTDSAERCTGGVPEDQPRFATEVPIISTPDGYENVVYLCSQGYEGHLGHACARSLDGGQTFGPRGQEAFPYGDLCDSSFGHVATGPDGAVWLVTAGCDRPFVAVSRDEAVTWERLDLDFAVGQTSGTGEAGIAVDAEGRPYVAWADAERLVRLAYLEDGEWQDVGVIAPPGLREANLVSIAVGGPGKLAVAYLGSLDAPGGPQPRVPEACVIAPCSERLGWENATWHAWLTITTDLFAERPVFVSAVVNEPTVPVVRGTCGPGRCKSALDFLDVEIGRGGAPYIAFVACPGGACETSIMRGAWASGDGMIGTLDGVDLR